MKAIADSWLPLNLHALHHRFKKGKEKENEKAIKERSKSGGLVIKCHAKAVKKVMGKGKNFLEGWPRKSC